MVEQPLISQENKHKKWWWLILLLLFLVLGAIVMSLFLEDNEVDDLDERVEEIVINQQSGETLPDEQWLPDAIIDDDSLDLTLEMKFN